jgi:hypothetical protein
LTDSGLVCYGFFEKPQGLSGRLVLRVFVLGRAAALSPGTVLHCGERELLVLASREKDQVSVTVELKGVSGEEALSLKGEEVFVHPGQVTGPGFPLPVYLFQGFEVLSRGRRFPVLEVEWNPVNPQVVLSGPKGPFWAPMNLLALGKVDFEAREILAELPEGLEDL